MSEQNKNIPFLQTFKNVVLVNNKQEKYNITANVQELTIYEDLFSNTMSGNLLFIDSSGSADRMNMVGAEKIRIELIKDSKNDVIEIKEFFVYSMTDRVRNNFTSEGFLLHFVSVETLLNENTRIYQALYGVNSDSVQSCFKYIGSDKKLDVESTNGNYKFVMPSWTPFEAINWYCGRSISASSNGSYFLFYENMNGFNFKSVESLIKSNTVASFKYQPVTSDLLNKDLSNIREFEVSDMSDTLEGFDERNTTLWSNDLVRKKIVKKRFEYETDSKAIMNKTLLGAYNKNGFNIDFKARRDVFGSNIIVRNETRNVHTQTETYYYDSIQKKLSAIRQFSNLKIRFLTSGRRDIKVGDTIDLSFFQTKTITKDNKDSSEDKILSGKYLVSAIRYIFKPQDFQMSIEAVKDSSK